MSSPKKKFVAVGTGGRIPMFIDPIVRDYADSCELLGLCDLSPVRMEYHRKRLAESYGHTGEIALYRAEDFDQMLDDLKPDVVIVCTMDSTHHEYIVRSLDKGCDVVSEKPITTDEVKCRQIFDAVERSGHKVRVTFNLRWSPGVTKVRELLQNGIIGNIKHVQMEYLLNTSHGADYFRRWHSHKKNSGGLLVHKSTHHFDLVNWWIDSIPKTVYSIGDCAFYGKKNAIARGDEALTTYARYTGQAPKDDPFYLNLDEEEASRALYRNAEAETGYIRDQNVFREGIDAEDTMSVIVRYRNGVALNYSLNAFCPQEGFRVAFTGDRGRLEYEEIHQTHIIMGKNDEELAKEQATSFNPRTLTIRPLFKEPYQIEIPIITGGHGGGDALIQEQIFSSNPPVDLYHRSAGHEQGAASALLGIAANHSIASGLPVQVDDLVKLNPATTRLSELI